MWQVVYYPKTEEIKAILPIDQPYDIVFQHYPDVSEMDVIYIDSVPDNWKHYYVKDGKLIKRSDEEIKEFLEYGKILTAEERILNQMKPSDREVREAEQTIKLLSLLQEVLE